jgi:hypothetical protein
MGLGHWDDLNSRQTRIALHSSPQFLHAMPMSRHMDEFNFNQTKMLEDER